MTMADVKLFNELLRRPVRIVEMFDSVREAFDSLRNRR